jgi:hypothetical protein
MSVSDAFSNAFVAEFELFRKTSNALLMRKALVWTLFDCRESLLASYASASAL